MHKLSIGPAWTSGAWETEQVWLPSCDQLLRCHFHLGEVKGHKTGDQKELVWMLNQLCLYSSVRVKAVRSQLRKLTGRNQVHRCVRLDLLNVQCQFGENLRTSNFSPKKTVRAVFFRAEKIDALGISPDSPCTSRRSRRTQRCTWFRPVTFLSWDPSLRFPINYTR